MSCNSVAIAGLFLIKRGKAVKAKAKRMLKKEKKGSKKIIMVIMIIILLLIIGAVIFLMNKNFNKPEEKTDLLENNWRLLKSLWQRSERCCHGILRIPCWKW